MKIMFTTKQLFIERVVRIAMKAKVRMVEVRQVLTSGMDRLTPEKMLSRKQTKLKKMKYVDVKYVHRGS